jgi:hypothetical protein
LGPNPASEAPVELEMSAARLKHFGWGREGEGLTAEEEAFVIGRAEARFGAALKESASAPRLEDIKLEAPRATPPASLPFCTPCLQPLQMQTASAYTLSASGRS